MKRVDINFKEQADLLCRQNQLRDDKSKQFKKDLQMYLHKYQELLQNLDDTIRIYKETARKVKGRE